MLPPRARKPLGLIVLLLVLAFIVNAVAGLAAMDRSAFDAARAACQERGLQLDDVSGKSLVTKSGLLGRTAEVRFQGRRGNRPAAVNVTLRKPLDLLAWQVADVREELPDH